MILIIHSFIAEEKTNPNALFIFPKDREVILDNRPFWRIMIQHYLILFDIVLFKQAKEEFSLIFRNKHFHGNSICHCFCYITYCFTVVEPAMKEMLNKTEIQFSDRFIFLKTTQSFYGREDLELEGRMAAELPGILNWSLAGLARLKRRKKFITT